GPRDAENKRRRGRPPCQGQGRSRQGGHPFVREELSELLCAFRVNLDRDSRAYRRLGITVLPSYLRALQAIESRNRGQVIESPHTTEPEHNVAMGSTLSAALDGRKKAKQPSRTVLFEFDHAVRRFNWTEAAPIRQTTRRRD